MNNRTAPPDEGQRESAHRGKGDGVAIDERVRAWLEKEFGAHRVVLERQKRWRPAWFADVDRGDEILRLYLRGQRGGNFREFMTLDQEADIHRILTAHGVPVPRVLAMMDDPKAIVMERLSGQIDLATAESDEAREAVLDQYIDAAVRMYEIDVAEFAAIGLEIPTNPEQAALNLYARMEKLYRSRKAGPNPMVEFMCRWMHANYPRHRNKASLIQTDAAQFMFKGSKLTGLLDFEAAYVGDPVAEFAAMRLRDMAEKLGDLEPIIRRYEQRTGDHLDKASIEFHTLGWCLTGGPFSWEASVHQPAAGDTWLEYFIWYVTLSRWGLEAIAEVTDVKLEPIEEPAASLASATTAAARVHLRSSIEEWPHGDTFDDYHRDCALALARFVERTHRYSPAIERQDLEEISEILGVPQPDLRTAEGGLEKFVLAAGPEHDERLVRYFHRWTQRQEFLLTGTGAFHEGMLHISPQRVPELGTAVTAATR